MPYLSCPGCRLTVYSAAARSTVDHCPRCEARLFIGPPHSLDATRRGGEARLPFLEPHGSPGATGHEVRSATRDPYAVHT
jgi:hypothetical protein